MKKIVKLKAIFTEGEQSKEIRDDKCANSDSNGSERTEIFPDPETEMPSTFCGRIQEQHKNTKLQPLDINTPVFPDQIRFVCLSDTHTMLGNAVSDANSDYFVPSGDILIHAGDFTNEGRILEIERFNTYLGQLPHKKKIVIAGNHELSFDQTVSTDDSRFGDSSSVIKRHLHSKGVKHVKDLITNAVYLQDSMVTICGLNIYGSPWQPRYSNGWAFNAGRGEEILQKWNWIPENVDILITHGPPVGYGDRTIDDLHVGCEDLLNTVQKRVKPKFHVFGHIHEGYGISTDGVTTFINASSCTRTYILWNPPVIFDIPLPHGESKKSLLKKVDVVTYANGLPKKHKVVQKERV